MLAILQRRLIHVVHRSDKPFSRLDQRFFCEQTDAVRPLQWRQGPGERLQRKREDESYQREREREIRSQTFENDDG